MKPTRQQLYQARQRAAGRCRQCGTRALVRGGKPQSRCKACREKQDARNKLRGKKK